MTETYTLTAAEAAMYDSQDDEQTSRLMTDLRARFGRIAGGAPVQTEVRHPDGFVVEQYTRDAVKYNALLRSLGEDA